jgi:hypothetical protein
VHNRRELKLTSLDSESKAKKILELLVDMLRNDFGSMTREAHSRLTSSSRAVLQTQMSTHAAEFSSIFGETPVAAEDSEIAIDCEFELDLVVHFLADGGEIASRRLQLVGPNEGKVLQPAVGNPSNSSNVAPAVAPEPPEPTLPEPVDVLAPVPESSGKLKTSETRLKDLELDMKILKDSKVQELQNRLEKLEKGLGNSTGISQTRFDNSVASLERKIQEGQDVLRGRLDDLTKRLEHGIRQLDDTQRRLDILDEGFDDRVRCNTENTLGEVVQQLDKNAEDELIGALRRLVDSEAAVFRTELAALVNADIERVQSASRLAIAGGVDDGSLELELTQWSDQLRAEAAIRNEGPSGDSTQSGAHQRPCGPHSGFSHALSTLARIGNPHRVAHELLLDVPPIEPLRTIAKALFRSENGVSPCDASRPLADLCEEFAVHFIVPTVGELFNSSVQSLAEGGPALPDIGSGRVIEVLSPGMTWKETLVEKAVVVIGS